MEGRAGEYFRDEKKKFRTVVGERRKKNPASK